MTSLSAPDIDALSERVVGRRRELEVLVAALSADRHVLLEGPPGTGKSTILREVAAAAGTGFVFVEGNAELTPARLAGQFDPSRVLEDGYTSDVFVDGPLVEALRHQAAQQMVTREVVGGRARALDVDVRDHVGARARGDRFFFEAKKARPRRDGECPVSTWPILAYVR